MITPPAQEGAIAVGGSVLLGVPIGVGLAVLSVRTLNLFFTLPPPFVSVPAGSLALFALLTTATSAVAIGVALAAITRIHAARVLRGA
jgi:putative ABC transport system permease protein